MVARTFWRSTIFNILVFVFVLNGGRGSLSDYSNHDGQFPSDVGTVGEQHQGRTITGLWSVFVSATYGGRLGGCESVGQYHAGEIAKRPGFADNIQKHAEALRTQVVQFTGEMCMVSGTMFSETHILPLCWCFNI